MLLLYRFPPDLSTQPHRNPPVRFANAEFPSKRRRPVPGVSLKPPVRQFPPQTACPKEHPSPPPRRILLYPKPSFPPKNAPVLVNEPPGGPAARVFRRRPLRRNQPPGSANGIRPQKFSRSRVYSEAPKGQPPRKPQLHLRTASIPRTCPSPYPDRTLSSPTHAPRHLSEFVNEPTQRTRRRIYQSRLPTKPVTRVFRRRPPRRNQPPGFANGIRPQKFSRSGVYSEAPKGQPPRKPQLHFRTASIPRTCPSLYPDRTLSSPTHAPRHLSKFVNERPKQIRPKNFPPSAEFSDRAWKLPLDASPDPRPVNLLRGPPAPKCPSLSTSPPGGPAARICQHSLSADPKSPRHHLRQIAKAARMCPSLHLARTPFPSAPCPQGPSEPVNKAAQRNARCHFPRSKLLPLGTLLPSERSTPRNPPTKPSPTARINFHFFPIQIPDTRSLQIHQRGRAPPNQKSLPKNTAPKIFGGSI